MKNKVQRITLALAALALAAGTALAEVRTKTVAFDKDVKVGGVTLKKGTYKAAFDDQTNELTITSNGKTVARAAAKLEGLKSGKYESVYSSFKAEDGSNLLLSVNVGGKNAVINDESVAQALRKSEAQ